MQIGVLILPASPWKEQCAYWRLADQLGFAHAWTYDHIAWRDLIGKTWFAAMPTLTAAACATQRIKLGTLVMSPNFRQPVPLAKEALTLSDISAGRFILGIGAGTPGADAQVIAEKICSLRERADRFSEFVQLTDRLLREPVVDFAGQFYTARQARIDPSATARAQIQLAIATAGQRGIRLAARYADIWVTNGSSPAPEVIPPAATPGLVREQIEQLHEACCRVGKDFTTIRKLLLNTNRSDPPLRSIEGFRDAVGRYGEAGITDMVVPFPRSSQPFNGDIAMLEKIAGDLRPEPAPPAKIASPAIGGDGPSGRNA
jgi:alkanesulfonate monooxygenase SsuD/methylene tetrahydromethanopterin reductase-like flavin-dependent oxidoreductase (luciferase family)